MKLALLPLLLLGSSSKAHSAAFPSSSLDSPSKERCSCLPRSFTIKLDLTKSCSDNQDRMISNGGVSAIQCHDHDSLIQGLHSSNSPPSHITDIEMLEIGYTSHEGDTGYGQLLNSATFDNLNFVSGQSFGFESVINKLSPNSELDHQLEFVPDRLVITMRGPSSANKDEEVEIVYELEYQKVYFNKETGLCEDGLVAKRGDELGYLQFSYMDNQLNRFCPKEKKNENAKIIRGANHPSAAAKLKNGKNKNSSDKKNMIKEKVFTKATISRSTYER